MTNEDNDQWHDGCPIPSAHDKLEEAHYFLHEMIDHYHQGHRLRWSLSAFLQALSTVVNYIEDEVPIGIKGRGRFMSEIRSKLKNPEIKLLKRGRDIIVHESALVAHSTASVGLFKGHRSKITINGIQLNPMTDSLECMLRLSGTGIVDPHRASIAEGLGIERKWVLESDPSVELVERCHGALNLVGEIVNDAHRICGQPTPTHELCGAPPSSYMILHEAEIFPQLEEIWDGQPPGIVECRGDKLAFRKNPSPYSEVFRELNAGQELHGWVGLSSRFWPASIASILPFRFEDKELVDWPYLFFDRRGASIQPARGDGTAS